MDLKLLTNLPCVTKGGKPMHLAIVTSIHLLRTEAPLRLHILGSLGLLEINEDRKLNTREEIPIDERIITPFVVRPKHIICILLRLQSLVALNSQNFVGDSLQLKRVIVEYYASLHGLKTDEATEPYVKGSPKLVDEQGFAGMGKRQPSPDTEQGKRDEVIPIHDKINLGLWHLLGSAEAEGVPEGAASRHHISFGERGAIACVWGHNFLGISS
mmetsp:Transcript_8991/g.16463  ORF Transcript_8991/g.16463 Transcript_8991/m.16463 type:complete len:214 (-) Transcript_8991:155-796(-)